MYKIYKITSNPTVDFAAEELKKYLRMMMTECGEIEISYAPDAVDGFRLGLMADFGLDTSESDDLFLDDIVDIDVDENGNGVIAGSNPRSVLLAVYRYLTINGCRWLYPGIDGEYIPIKNIEAVKYHKMADCRYRGQCNEGGEAQYDMIESIDFTPKIGMNIFMIEFDNPYAYYANYYNHKYNEMNREKEPVNFDTVLQWKRQCEAEISKRGLQYHDMGHGWTAESFGLDTRDGWRATDAPIPEDIKKYVAMMDGERKYFGGVPLNTNFCMSNPEARRLVANKIADYAENATNVDYLHVWLADGYNNHCECEECQKKIPSDWYMMLMNELDEELTRRELDTRIVFICYVDTTWAPETVTINNPKRFSLLLAAITRDYTECVEQNLDTSKIKLAEYKRNKNELPGSVNEYIAHAKKWQEKTKVQTFVYEYHYWLPQYRDLGLFDSCRMVYDDIRGYRSNDCHGLVEDGSQRSFWPNGFSYFIYGNTHFNTSVDFEEMKEDYFSHAYGEDWREVAAFFEKLGKAADFRYLNGKLSLDGNKGGWGKAGYYNPTLAESFRKIPEIVEEFRPFVVAHKNMPMRVQTVSYRLLEKYLEYCVGMSKFMVLKCMGADAEANEQFWSFFTKFGKYEQEIERYYDQFMCCASHRSAAGKTPTVFLPAN